MHVLFLADDLTPQVSAPVARNFEHWPQVVRGQAQSVITTAPGCPKCERFARDCDRCPKGEAMSGRLRCCAGFGWNRLFLRSRASHLTAPSSAEDPR